MTQQEALRKLHNTCHEAIEFVGSANYAHRERAATKAIAIAFTNYAGGRYDEVAQSIHDIWEADND